MRKGGVLSYLLADHLGSTRAVLDASGNVVSGRTYWPYGAERSMSGDQRATDQWYTGQRDVGLAAGHRDPEHPAVVHLIAMWVHPSFRRIGAADALVAEVLSWAKSEGADAGDTDVNSARLPGLAGANAGRAQRRTT